MRVAQPGQQRAHAIELEIARPRLSSLVVDSAVPEGKHFVVGHVQKSVIRDQESSI